MPSLKLTKTAVETARPEARDYELRDTTLAGFICNLIQGRHLAYHWNGVRIDCYRDAGSGEVYRVN